MSNVNNVTAAKPSPSGAIRVAPYGTALPTAATATLADAWVTLGYISEDGYTNGNTITSSSTKDWSGETIFDGETEKTDTIKTKLMEALNTDVLKFIYGDNNVVVETDGSFAVHANNREHSAVSLCIDEILKDGRKARTVAANAVLTGLDDIEHKAGTPMGYSVTISMKPDSAHKVTDSDGTVYNDTHVTYYTAPVTTATATS